MGKIIRKISSWVTTVIPTDKIYHFFAGFIIFFVESLAIFALSHNHWLSIAIGELAVLAVAYYKEVSDKEEGEKFDWFDFLATILGGALASLIFLDL